MSAGRVRLEDYGNLVYAVVPGADADIVGEARKTDGNAGMRWSTNVGGERRLYETKADAKRDLRTLAQVLVDARGEAA